VGWYLCVEEDVIGQEHGLIRCERLDRLALQGASTRSGSLRGGSLRSSPSDGLRRSPERQHAALQRLERLLHHSGGIHFGDDIKSQPALASRSPGARAGVLQTLRFSATPWAFAFLREGMGRYPREQVRFSKPLPGDSWWHHPEAPHVLEPNAPNDSHPYPLELDLPSWTIAADIDLSTWLYGFGEGIRVESPSALRQELVKGWSLSWWGEAELSSVLPQPLNSSRPSLLLSRAQGDELDLLAAELDLELIAGFEAQLGGVGLAHHQVAVELDLGGEAEAAARPPLAAAAAGTQVHPLGLQQRLIEGGEVQALRAVLLGADIAGGTNQI
jgi:hypothetical protein